MGTRRPPRDAARGASQEGGYVLRTAEIEAGEKPTKVRVGGERPRPDPPVRDTGRHTPIYEPLAGRRNRETATSS